MDIQRIVMGHLATNCYLIKQGRDVLIIDPVQDAPRIQARLDPQDVVHAILLTHGHFDHIGAVDDLFAIHQCPVYLHQDDHTMAKHPKQNFSFKQNISIKSPLLNYSTHLTLGPFDVEIFETPGHSQGCVVIKIQDHLFTGDTLFKEDIGRTDLEGSDPRQMRQSLKLFRTFKEDLWIYPGHDDLSRLSHELKNNPYL